MQKHYKLLFINLIILILFFGCTPPSAFTFFKKDKLKANALQYTKVIQIVNDGKVEAILNASYLNSIDEDFDDDKQNFIFGLYIADEDKDIDKKYFITVNDKNATYSSLLNEQHKMYGHIPFFNNWAKYYLMKFDTDENTSRLKVTLHWLPNTDNNSTKTVETTFQAE